MLPLQRQTIASILADAAAELARAASRPVVDDAELLLTLERPKVAAHGDAASNLALQLAKLWRADARQLAQQLARAALAHPRAPGLLEAAEVAGPGFINLRLNKAAKQAVVKAVLTEKEAFGRACGAPDTSDTDARQVMKRVIIEFVSANPTGPLHVGHGRQAVLGDVLANLLALRGARVHREFYYNDAGAQIHQLALSVQARARGLAPGDVNWPAGAYQGEYITDIARAYVAAYVAGARVAAQDGEQLREIRAAAQVDNLDAIKRFAVAYLRREQDRDLQALGVKFDHYYLESSLYLDGRVEAVVAALTAAGKTYEHEGALWLRTADEGDDKDRVMRKSDGTYTYFVPDIAYHLTKWERGFKRAINIQGADHHGTIARVRAGLQQLALGIPKGYPDYVLHKMVTVVRNGQEVRLSKRAGSYVTLRDLIEWAGGRSPDAINGLPADDETIRRGRDAVRFFLVSRKADTEFVFDIDLALKQNDDNPVYYIQYAHARICSVLAQWRAQWGEEDEPDALAQTELTLLDGAHEIALLQCLADYPEVLARAADELAPHRVAFYLRDLARAFHAFYNAERVLVDSAAVRRARIALIAAVRQVIANGLTALGVSAPSTM